MSKVDKEKVEEVDIIVSDPQVLRPVDLPLVIKLPEGQSWKNEAQEKYVQVLNGYAYKNPTKWESKKDVLIKQLKELGDNPSKLNFYMGIDEKLSYGNKLIK